MIIIPCDYDSGINTAISLVFYYHVICIVLYSVIMFQGLCHFYEDHVDFHLWNDCTFVVIMSEFLQTLLFKKELSNNASSVSFFVVAFDYH